MKYEQKFLPGSILLRKLKFGGIDPVAPMHPVSLSVVVPKEHVRQDAVIHQIAYDVAGDLHRQTLLAVFQAPILQYQFFLTHKFLNSPFFCSNKFISQVPARLLAYYYQNMVIFYQI